MRISISKKIFTSEDTGFGVFSALNSKTWEEIIVVGELFDVNVGDVLKVKGEISNHKKFGEQLKVESYQILLPDDKKGIKKYLIDRVSGIGKKTADKIVEHFGSDTFKILEAKPERLKEIKGLRKKIINEIQGNLKDNHIIRELTERLSKYKIGRHTISKLYKELGESVIDILQSNPYFLIENIKGIGFKIADNIAKSYGIESDSPFRINAGIDFILNENEQKNGNLYIEKDTFIKKSKYLLDVSDSIILDEINNKIIKNEIIKEKIPEDIFIKYETFLIEKEIAGRLLDISKLKDNEDKKAINIDLITEDMNIELAKEQKEAVYSTLNNGLTIITGGPGTGKTTIIRVIIELFMDMDKKVKIAAPTGRAAKRIEETSGYAASTIHRLLKVDSETGRFVHDETKPLKADIIIIDESSMIDTYIFLALIRAISSTTRVVFIGDRDQLPSVGPGNILRDLINSEKFSTIFLSRNFRQSKDSLIIENAYRINTGEKIITKAYTDLLDFVSIDVTNNHIVIKKIINIIKYYKDDYKFNSSEIQILVPMYRGEAGITKINMAIQEEFNDNVFYINKENVKFKKNDKVMQLKNNYEKDVFNGEQGTVHSFDEDKKTLSIEFDGKIIEYDLDELDELTLSYAVSVHKSQGSEFDMVMLVLLPYHSIMLNREIFYTAVTRAKKKLFLISDPQTIQTAISNSSPADRKTLLEKRINELEKEI